MNTNMVKAALERIFGERLPKGTTNFHTCDGTAFFLIGATGKLVDVEMTQDQIELLRERGILGTFGWALQ